MTLELLAGHGAHAIPQCALWLLWFIFSMRVGIGIAALGLLLSGCAGTPKHPTWGNATGGEQHERLMWKAIHDKDWGNVERHLSPTFIGVNAQGQMLDRIGWLAYWKSVQPAELSLGELAVQP